MTVHVINEKQKGDIKQKVTTFLQNRPEHIEVSANA
jgi:hypothetical protein